MKDKTRKTHRHKWLEITHNLLRPQLTSMTHVSAFDLNGNGPRVTVCEFDSVFECDCGSFLCIMNKP